MIQFINENSYLFELILVGCLVWTLVIVLWKFK